MKLGHQIVDPSTRNESASGKCESIAAAARETQNTCRCSHLEAFLPHLLDLECIPSSPNSTSWTIVNPVHALHLASLLQPDGCTILLPKGHLVHTQPSLFGDEQRRTDALLSPGIAGSFCPLPQPARCTDKYTYTETAPVRKERESMVASEAVPGSEEATVSMGVKSEESSGPVTILGGEEIASSGGAETAASTPVAAPVPVTTPIQGVAGVASTSNRDPERASDAPLKSEGSPGAQPSMMKVSTSSVSDPMPEKSAQGAPVTVGSKDGTPISGGLVTPVVPEVAASSVESERGISSTISPAAAPPSQAKPATQFLLPEGRYHELRRMEELILQQRRGALAKRKDKKSATASKKRKKETTKGKNGVDLGLPQVLPGSYLNSIGSAGSHGSHGDKGHTRRIHRELWEQDAKLARSKVEEWVERFRQSRNAYWDHRQDREQNKQQTSISPFGALGAHSSRPSSRVWNDTPCRATSDGVLQCLECEFVGYGPNDSCNGSAHNIIHHMIETGHSFAVTCGDRAEVYCFDCGDLVAHAVFDQERERIDISRRLPWMGWTAQPVQRSFDALQFATISDYGVVWRGLFASYPLVVPNEYRNAAQMTLHRSRVFRGEPRNQSLTWGPKALDFALYQESRGTDNWKIRAPVGAYNLGQTCFMSSVINVLVHCVPFQRHFLLDVRHDHRSCRCLRRYVAKQLLADTASAGAATSDTKPLDSIDDICLACEMDNIFLDYFGSSVGKDARAAACEPPNSSDHFSYQASASAESKADLRGEPLVLSDLLTAAWRSGGMDLLAGYEQRDAHEFLQAFLDTLGKHCRIYQDTVRKIRNQASTSKGPELMTGTRQRQDCDIVNKLFEGTLRSVLICGECGCKRSLPETYLNISLPLAKQMEGTSRSSNLSLQWCLQHFTDAEALADPVDCPSCAKKTTTRKQHTFARLPKVLCIHLKRFDAANNRKITDFVSYPEFGLDMGPLLPHWREVEDVAAPSPADSSAPELLYDLFGSVNHKGTLVQGHYTSNVKVGEQWYHCNDAHVSLASNDGSVGDDVLKCEGAYMLFYIRR